MANGPQLMTVPFSDKRCIHTSCQDQLLRLTLIVFSLSVPKQQEVHPNSSDSQTVLVTHEYPDLRMSFNYLTGQNRDNKRALRGTKLPSLLANSASIDWGLRSHPAVTYRNCTTSNWGSERQSMISSQFPHILYNREQKSMYLAHRESSRWVF